MTWINAGANGWLTQWFQDHAKQIDIFRDDGTGHWWVNMSNGDEIVLVSDGGWRMMKNGQPYDSRYRLFRRNAASADVRELSGLLWPVKRGAFNPDAKGSERYNEIQGRCQKFVDELLQALPIIHGAL